MEFGIEKCAMLVMKSGKRHRTEGIKLPNQDKIWTLGGNDAYKYLGILEADTIKQVEMKDKIQKEYLRRTRKLHETKLSHKNLIKRINIWAVPLLRYSGLFLKWPKDEHKQMDQRTRKLMTMHKATLRYYTYQEKSGEEDLLASKTAFKHRRLHRKTRTRTDYSHQKQCWQHDR